MSILLAADLKNKPNSHIKPAEHGAGSVLFKKHYSLPPLHPAGLFRASAFKQKTSSLILDLTGMKYFIFSALLLAGVVSCSKNNDATPSIPANTLQLTFKNKLLVFPTSATTLVVSQKSTSLYLAAQALDTTNASITIRAGALDTESPGFYSADSYNKSAIGGVLSKYVYLVTGYYRNPCGNPMTGYVTYETGATPAGALTTFPDFALNVLAVDKAAHTMSGTFAGSYWKGCDKMEITEGQFNLPYTVVP